MKITLVVLFLMAAVVPNAVASAPRAYWAVGKAEDVLLASRWAEDAAITDVVCDGRGRATPNRLGLPTFRLFKCRVSYQDWLTDDDEQFTLGLQVVGNPSRFALFSFSDLRFDANSDCFGYGD